MAAVGQTNEIVSTVTYVAAGQVYVGSGRSSGLTDSATAIVRRGMEIVTTLRLTAASSSSSAWSADSAVAAVRVGDVVSIRTRIALPAQSAPVDSIPAKPGPSILRSDYRRPARASSSAWIDLVGRIGAQVISMGYGEPTLELLQTGMVVSVRVRFRDLPLRMDLYANGRDVARGGARPWSARSSDASRLYRALIEYDDRVHIISLGRMTIPSAPTIGILDGLTAARRWGDVTTGLGLGFEPDRDLRGADWNRRKLVGFVAYAPASWSSASASGTYSKTWYRGASEREALNINGGVAVSDRVSIWASGDIDLRVTEAGLHRLSPSLSLLILTTTWRVTDAVSLSGGIDASRSVLPYSFARFIPDSMSDRTLRTGLTVSSSWLMAPGLSLSAMISPRMTGGDYQGEFASTASIAAYDLLRSGVAVRLQGLLSHNRISTGQGYGASTSFNALTIDWTLRTQQMHYRIGPGRPRSAGTTFGLDLLAPILPRLSWLASVDLVNGFGASSRSVFTELSYRF